MVGIIRPEIDRVREEMGIDKPMLKSSYPKSSDKEIPLVLKEYTDFLANLEEVITELETRLSPLLDRDFEADSNDHVSKSFAADLADHIHINNVRLNGYCQIIKDLLHQLQI